MIAQIEAKSAQVTTERIWSAPWPTLKVSYANVTNVWIRAVAADWDDYLKREHRRPETSAPPSVRPCLPARRPSVVACPASDHGFPLPDGRVPGGDLVEAGVLFSLRQPSGGFCRRRQPTLVDRCLGLGPGVGPRNRSGSLEGFVLEAESGEPIQDARIQAWHLDSNRNRVEIPRANTDSNGFFQLAAPQDYGGAE